MSDSDTSSTRGAAAAAPAPVDADGNDSLAVAAAPLPRTADGKLAAKQLKKLQKAYKRRGVARNGGAAGTCRRDACVQRPPPR